uniref:Succinate dehydrogenase cytochrome B560 subunit n=1 Tax=Gastroclonium compressum TaxID=1852973 RepID=A0A173FZQ3_GASCM|nr:succinate dehydrogenase cytochrome B560 subunit [Coeloseira compressa]
MFRKIYKFKRPIAPHLSIHVPQISSLLSIWHRLSGVIVFILFIYLFFSLEIVLQLNINFFLFPWLKTFLFYIFYIFFFYHSLNGLKYIFYSFLIILKFN